MYKSRCFFKKNLQLLYNLVGYHQPTFISLFPLLVPPGWSVSLWTIKSVADPELMLLTSSSWWSESLSLFLTLFSPHGSTPRNQPYLISSSEYFSFPLSRCCFFFGGGDDDSWFHGRFRSSGQFQWFPLSHPSVSVSAICLFSLMVPVSNLLVWCRWSIGQLLIRLDVPSSPFRGSGTDSSHYFEILFLPPFFNTLIFPHSFHSSKSTNGFSYSLPYSISSGWYLLPTVSFFWDSLFHGRLIRGFSSNNFLCPLFHLTSLCICPPFVYFRV